jgi:ATP-grasp ribosomal peptide maturase
LTTARPVLVATQVDDPTADIVIQELNARSIPVMRFDPGKDFPQSMTLTAHLGVDGVWSGDLVTATRSLDLHSVRSVYWRRPSPYTAPTGLVGQDGEFAKTQARFGFGGVIASLDTLHVNHPRRIHSAEYKPAQLVQAARLGFTVPRTLITNDPAEAVRFADAYGPIIYKVLRQTSHEINGRAATVWVAEVDPADLDAGVSATAHLFQQKVPKVADARVTVVNHKAFCVRIDSADGLLDWRADYGQLRYSVIQAPAGILVALEKFLEAFGLVFGCFDFAIDQAGDWTWLECNPNGQWAWMEEPTGLPMTAAFADLLEGK